MYLNLDFYQLSNNVENLLLDRNHSTGEYALDGFGNVRDNIIQSNDVANFIDGDDGDDTIEGAAGNDILYGGVGNDSFLYRDLDLHFSFDRRNFGIDKIEDFDETEDTILLDQNLFLNENGFFISNISSELKIVNNINQAMNSNAVIVYNQNNGVLYYNANGSAPGFASNSRGDGAFIILDSAPSITNANFDLVDPLVNPIRDLCPEI